MIASESVIVASAKSQMAHSMVPEPLNAAIRDRHRATPFADR
jgi:hypothetical protein